MLARIQGSIGMAIVAALLIIQGAVFSLSMDALIQVSAFCAGPMSSLWGLVFGLVHLSLFVLLFVGLFALQNVRLRLTYIALVTMALFALPIQAVLVSQGTLSCDLP